MKRSRSCRMFAAVFALTAACISGAASRPNVIVIVTDDQGYGDMSAHGNPWLKTPHLDRLRAEGARLENYHVDPVCTPTRAALMTGRYSTRVGAWAVTEGRQLLDPREQTMGDVFAASGYRTGMFGKWHLGDNFPFAPQYRGFQEVVCHRAGGVDEIGNPAGNDYFDDTYFRNGRPERFAGYCTDVFFSEAMRFIDRDRAAPAGERKPFFVYLATNAMHAPFTAAENYVAPFLAAGLKPERARFFGMISNFDENLGRLMQALQSSGRDRDTLVIFMGDNGTAAGVAANDPLDGFNAGMRGRKGSVFDGGHRVACFVRWPGGVAAGRRVDRLTMHCDWLPTLIEWCGLKAPENVAFDGRSIAPLIADPSAPWPERTLVVSRQGDRLQRWSGAGAPNGYPHRAVLTERWRLVDDELFDLPADPAQRKSVAASHRDQVARLSAAHDAWFADVTSRHEAYTRFVIGAPQENPTTFTVRDWHPTEGAVIWQQAQLGDDTLFINGFWAVEAARAGRYEIKLARHPADAMRPMKASQARLKIDVSEQRLDMDTGDGEVKFSIRLSAGPAILQTWLKDAATGRERGAYFVTSTWLGP